MNTNATQDDDMLAIFKNIEFATRWALKHLEDFEIPAFLRDRVAGKDLRPWLKAWRLDQECI